MKSIIVLSTPDQLDLFQKAAHCQNAAVFCDNEALFPLLDDAKIPFTRLDDFLIRDQWAVLNSWGCAKATGWIGLTRHLTPRGDVDVLPPIFLFFACFLIAAAKSKAFAEYLTGTEDLSLVYVFSDCEEPIFPSFSGNAFLNYFLKTTASEKGIRVQTLDVPFKKNVPGNGINLIRVVARRIAGKLMTGLFARLPEETAKTHLVVYGSLRHLGSVTDFLLKKKVPVLIFDNEFHGQIFLWAALRKIPYLTADQLRTPALDALRQRSKSLNDQWLSKFAEAERLGHFRDNNGYDFSDLIRTVIFPIMPKYFDRVANDLFRFNDLLSSIPVAGCLVDEDFGFRANFCELFKSSGKEVFCISHGQGMYDFDTPPETRSFSQSWTFVNSEHERMKMYGSLGWDLSRVIVTGTPRYDRLDLAAKRSRPHSALPKKILYCPGCLSPNTPNAPGFLGLDVYSYKRFQEMAFQSFVEASEGLPIEIIVKSHYHSDDAIWFQNIKKISTRTPIRLHKHSADFHTLLAQSHAMILPSLSSSLVEAALCHVPVIFMAIHSQDRPVVRELASHGLCYNATSTAAIRQELERIIKSESELVFSSADDSSREYYLGTAFGSASKKVGEMILSILNGDEHRLSGACEKTVAGL